MSSQDYNILVVDDVADNLFLLQTILEAEGYNVDVANSGRSALKQFEISPPDLVLLDVMMPDMSGYEVTRRIRQSEKFSDTPIMLITAHDESVARQGLTFGADDFVRKPINFDELLTRVKALCN